jgi:hypothetical protein
MMDPFERNHIPVTTALLAVIASSLLRAPWFALLLIAPATATGVLLCCFVLISAGVVLLHWCLGWFGWTLRLRSALAARALPAVVAVSTTGALGLDASLPVLIAMGVLEVLLATAVVAAKATHLEHGYGTGFEEGELLPAHPDEVVSAEDRYGRNVADLVREARDARLRPSGRTSY